MAIKKKAQLGIVDYIHHDDDAINTDLNEETGKPYSDIKAYQEDGNFKKHCVLHEDRKPTVFKVNFNVPYDKAVAIKNATLSGSGSDQGFKYGNHSNQVVRTVLVDIVNPPDMPLNEQIVFAKDKKTGLVSDRVMKELEDLGLVDAIYTFYLSNKDAPENLKKR